MRGETITDCPLLQADQLDTARLLIQFSADINIANKYGLTPLDIAHTFGRVNFINMFSDLINK